ncbi:hypothetical protein [Ilumatobacter nonamiensis]|uniref:hypothetical protein n=1 Tax=Ilumatobacter nonamiensis TaxID=467093 RepID=UPI0011D17D69|nr:hypothetical protein [Ilumatobacter nonamiensis]
MADQTDVLPPGVRAAWPSLHSLSDAITILTVLFVYEEDDPELAEAMRRDYESTFSVLPPRLAGLGPLRRTLKRALRPRKPRRGSGYSMHRPNELRRQAAQDVLSRRRQQCVAWVAERVPGSFSTAGVVELPSIQLVLTEKADPTSEPGLRDRWLANTGVDTFGGGPWRSESWPAVRLWTPGAFSEPESSALSLIGRRSDAFPQQDGSPDDSNFVVAQRANDYLQGLLVRWAHSQMLATHRKQLAELRDAAARLDRSTSWPVRDLKQRRRAIHGLAGDVAISTAAAKRLASNKLGWHMDVLDLVEAEPFRGREADRLTERMRLNQIALAQDLEEDLPRVMTILSTDSELAANLSNIRLQRFVLLLTAVAVSIALWAASVASDEPEPAPPSVVEEVSD